MSSISLLQAQEMIARCERNRKKPSPDPYACPDAYDVPEQKEVGRSGIHEDIEKWLRSLGNRCFYVHHRTDKRVSMFQTDVDFTGWMRRDTTSAFDDPVCFAIEIKSKGKKPTLEQLARLKQAECAGAITGVAHSLAEFKALMGMI